MLKNVAQQLKQITQNTFETIKDQPKELGTEVLEQLGVSAKGGSALGGKPSLKTQEDDPSLQIQRMAELDKQQSDRQARVLRREIDEEIKKAQMLRDQQLQERRQPFQPTLEEVAGQQAAPLPDTTKITPKRGGWLFGAGRRKNRSAFDQFSSEKRQGSGVGG